MDSNKLSKKWTYLETDSVLPSSNTFLKALPTYRFKVFRYTTRFKKFNIGITKMVRRKYARRKHQTTWVSHSYVAKYWTVNYMKEKQFSRFVQSLGTFNITVGSPSVEVFNTQLRNITNYNGINIISCSKPILNKYISFLNNKSYLDTFNYGGSPVLLQTSDLNRLNLSFDLNPNNMIFDKLQYPRDLKNFFDNQLTNQTFSLLTNSITSTIIQNTVSVRRILILLVLFNTHKL